jgi:chemotaxis-related protein WspB
VADHTLFVLIRLGEDRYAIDADLVVEVAPLVRLKALPGAPVGAAGVMIFRGDAIPVVDLNLIALGAPTATRLMTRIVVVHYAPGENREGALLGLLVPEVMHAEHLDEGLFEPVGLATDDAEYLGPVLSTPDGVLQRVDVAALLTDELRCALFRPELAA